MKLLLIGLFGAGLCYLTHTIKENRYYKHFYFEVDAIKERHYVGVPIPSADPADETIFYVPFRSFTSVDNFTDNIIADLNDRYPSVKFEMARDQEITLYDLYSDIQRYLHSMKRSYLEYIRDDGTNTVRIYVCVPEISQTKVVTSEDELMCFNSKLDAYDTHILNLVAIALALNLNEPLNFFATETIIRTTNDNHLYDYIIQEGLYYEKANKFMDMFARDFTRILCKLLHLMEAFPDMTDFIEDILNTPTTELQPSTIYRLIEMFSTKAEEEEVRLKKIYAGKK